MSDLSLVVAQPGEQRLPLGVESIDPGAQVRHQPPKTLHVAARLTGVLTLDRTPHRSVAHRIVLEMLVHPKLLLGLTDHLAQTGDLVGDGEEPLLQASHRRIVRSA